MKYKPTSRQEAHELERAERWHQKTKRHQMRVTISEVECPKDGCTGRLVRPKDGMEVFEAKVRWNEKDFRAFQLECESCGQALDLTVHAVTK